MKSNRPHIVVIGSANMDLVVKTERIPAPGETVLGGTFFQLAGGKGANQAVAAARLGAEVTFVGCVGADSFGDELLAGLEKDGIDCRFVKQLEGCATGVALIGVDEDGRNSIIVAPGANSKLSFEHIDNAMEAIRSADVMVAQLEVPLDVVDFAFGIAAEYGVLTILNPAPFRPGDSLPSTLWVDVLVPNEHEAAALLGLDTTDLDALTRRIEEVRSPTHVGPQGATIGWVVMTLGAQGSLVCGDGEPKRIPVVPAKAIDSTAAGDCYTGSLAVAIAEGKTVEEAARFASKAASISVTRLGAQPSLPTRQEVDALA